MDVQAPSQFALHLLHGWWTASCPDCGYEFARSRDQEAVERAGARRRCPICRPSTHGTRDGAGTPASTDPI
jgi:hypothetical protein